MRALHGDHRGSFRMISKRDVVLWREVLLNPVRDLGAIARVNNHPIERSTGVVGQVIHQDVVKDAPLLVGHQGVADFTRL